MSDDRFNRLLELNDTSDLPKLERFLEEQVEYTNEVHSVLMMMEKFRYNRKYPTKGSYEVYYDV